MVLQIVQSGNGKSHEPQGLAPLRRGVANPSCPSAWIVASLLISHKVSPAPPLHSHSKPPTTDHHMKVTSQHTKRKSTASGQRRYLFWALFAITVLSIVVPAAVMVSKRKKSTPPKASVLVPLYVYPSPGTWEPLFTASVTTTPPLSDDSKLTHLDRIASHPGLNFTVVVNPASGPGNGVGPDANYTREIPRLNAYANVRTVGYVSTDYAKRNLSLVLRDISTYSAWSENATFPGLGMHGIFLDETSSQYEPASAQFYETIASAVRSEAGFGSNSLVSHPSLL